MVVVALISLVVVALVVGLSVADSGRPGASTRQRAMLLVVSLLLLILLSIFLQADLSITPISRGS